MVERQFACWEFFAAVLAGVSVASEEILAVELYLISWEAVVEEQPNNFWDGDVEIYG